MTSLKQCLSRFPFKCKSYCGAEPVYSLLNFISFPHELTDFPLGDISYHLIEVLSLISQLETTVSLVTDYLKYPRIDLIHDTRYLCTFFWMVGIKTMSRDISGGQVIKFANTSNCIRVYLKTRERFNCRAKSTVRVSTSCTSLLLSEGHLRSLLHLKT